MTIKEAAGQYGITPQAVYKRLRENKIEVKTIIDAKTKHLTADGEGVVKRLFDGEGQNKPLMIHVEKASWEALNAEINQLKEKLSDLEKDIQAKEKRIDELESDRTFFKEQIAAAQAERTELINRIPTTQERRPGFIRRLLSGSK